MDLELIFSFYNWEFFFSFLFMPGKWYMFGFEDKKEKLKQHFIILHSFILINKKYKMIFSSTQYNQSINK